MIADPPKRYESSWSLGAHLKSHIPALLAAAAIVAVRLPYGYSPDSDEGFHLASAARYLAGDRPFVDEHYTTPISADLFLALFMAISPVDSVLWWRFVGLGLIVVAALAGTIGLTRRGVPTWLSTGTGMAIVLFTPFNLWVPYYKNLSMVFLLSAAAILLAAGRRPWAAAVSALLYVMAVVCYLPLGILWLPVVASYWLWRDADERAQVRRWVGWVWAFGVVLGLILLGGGYAGQAVANIREKMMFSQYQMSLVEKLRQRLFGHALFTELALVGMAVSTAIVVQHLGAQRRNRAYALVIGRIFLVSTFGALTLQFWRSIGAGGLAGRFPTVSTWLLLAHYAGLLAVAGYVLLISRTGRIPWTGLAPLVLAVVAGGVMAMSSASWASSIAEANVCSWLFWIGVAVASCALISCTSSAAVRASITMFQGVYMACMLAIASTHLWGWCYEDLLPSRLNGEFTDGKLAGLRSTRERVEVTKSLMAELVDRVEPGGTIIGYGGWPGISYLLNARPALYTSIVGPDQPPDAVMERWLEDMVRRRRSPRLVVSGAMKAGGRFEEFLAANYRREKTWGKYVVWSSNKFLNAPR